MSNKKKVVLDEADLPERWYNILPDLPEPPAPYLHPATLKPLGPDDLAPIFPQAIIAQEVSQERWIEIPDRVRELYRIWRPTPLYRAERLERALDTPARIYFKYEGGSPAGSHKPNTAIPQAYYNAAEGVKRLTTETGAGQWGSALALAGSLFGLEVTVYMVRVSYDQKPYRRALMETWGATVHPSPSPRTAAGRAVLDRDPDSPGSLGIAISEAVEDAAGREDSKYSLGSVVNHVLLHQTVIGLEAKKQMELVGDYPDVVVGCVGGGSNFAGLAYPFLADLLSGERTGTRFIAAEPAACPTLTRGVYGYDFGDTAGVGPVARMYTLGHNFVPDPIHAGGLRYHGDAPSLCLLVRHGLVEARAYPQNACFAEAVRFARTEGFLPAPEPSHALRAVVEEATAAREAGERRVILFGLCGHGHFDMSAYDAYLAGALEDVELAQERIDQAIQDLPAVPA
ncbi:MAG TPA: TrpB-like pyridoxal phosphate-dependent enzyme [Candidatus Dormibacteraeota bacterium]|nr:TrpB-like pyridoxal phosphate-dependent enzyme [Candidatus Dormibacteraeota bacterium]